MKIALVALASASLVAAGMAAGPVSAQNRGGGHGGGGGGYHGGGGGGGSGYHGGGGGYGGGHYAGGRGGYRGGYSGGRGYYGGRAYYGGRGYYGHGYYGGRYYGYGYGYPYFFGGAALGFALGSAYLSPWYYDYPPAYSYYSYRVDPGPSVYAAPPADYGAAPPAACGSWTWDTGRSTYFWTPCATPTAPQPEGYTTPPPTS
jgi:hypothetical protein